MVLDFYLTIPTNNVDQQIKFYRNLLGLDIIFQSDNEVGLGLYEELYILLTKKHERKGAPLITLKCEEDKTDLCTDISKSGYSIHQRSNLTQDKTCLIIEDFDGNPVCLDLEK